MKLKLTILLCALSAAVFSLAGCVDRNGSADSTGTSANSTTTTTTTTTTASMTSITPRSDDYDDDDDGMSDNGEYEADKDGRVNDDDGETDNSASGSSGKDRDYEGDSEARASDVTDDGIVSQKSTDKMIRSDEAAFASSYIKNTMLKNEKMGWGLGKERDSKNRPVDAVKAEERYAELGARFLSTEGKICLTFDEGYENGYTAAILDTLKEKDAKAIFFVTYDYCRTAPELVRRMIDEGHTVGNHTWSHPSMPDCTQKEVWSEVTKLHEYVKDEFGYEMTLFRFPMGEFSERTLDDVHNLGYTSLFWSFAYADWDPDKQTDPAEALAKIKGSTHSGIYLLHAVSSTNAQILGELIDYWRSQGYTVGSDC